MIPVQAKCKTTTLCSVRHSGVVILLRMCFYVIVAVIVTNCLFVSKVGILVRRKISFTQNENQYTPCEFSFII